MQQNIEQRKAQYLLKLKQFDVEVSNMKNQKKDDQTTTK